MSLVVMLSTRVADWVLPVHGLVMVLFALVAVAILLEAIAIFS